MTDAEQIEALEARVAALEDVVSKWLPALSADIVRSLGYVVTVQSSDDRRKADAYLNAIYENYYTLNPRQRPMTLAEALAQSDKPQDE